MESIRKALKEQVRMRNFTGEHLHVIENVGCRCKICKGSIFKSQKRQDADAIVWEVGLKVSASSKKSKLQIHWFQKEHLQQWISKPCRYIGLKKSICNNEYQGLADTTVTKKIIYLFLLRYTTEHCSLIHLICDKVQRKNIGYEFLWIQRKRLEILKGQNFTLELRNLLFEGVARVAGF